MEILKELFLLVLKMKWLRIKKIYSVKTIRIDICNKLELDKNCVFNGQCINLFKVLSVTLCSLYNKLTRLRYE